MPRIPTIVARESPLAGAPQSHASGEDFGAGIGRAMQGLGDTIQQVGGQLGQIGAERKAEADRLGVATVLANNTFTGTYNETVVSHPDPTGAGLAEGVTEKYDTWKSGVLANSGLSGDALKTLDLRLTTEKGMYVEKAYNDASTMQGNNAELNVKTGLGNIINDVRVHGATTPMEFELAFNKGALILQNMPGYDANQKAVGEAQLMSDLAAARFEAMADSQTTSLGIADVQKQLADPYWTDKLTPDQRKATQGYLNSAETSIRTETRSRISGALTQMSSRLDNHVMIPEDEWQTNLALFTESGADMTPEQAVSFRTMFTQQETLRQAYGTTPGASNEVETLNALPPGTQSRITYANRNATRNRPVAPPLASIYAQAADASGISEVRVVSGGQPRIGSGGKRTGSTRHDDGHAGDIQLIKDGRALQITNPNDLPVIIKFLQTSKALGAGGIGADVAYMGSSTFHVGFGTEATWGAGGKSANAPKWLTDALGGVTAGKAPSAGSGNGIGTAQLQAVGARYGVDANILDGMWFAESTRGTNPKDSPKGAQGPFGFMPGTWGQYGKGDVRDFAAASDAAARYMSDLQKQFGGDTRLALMAYNWGPGSVRDWLKEGADPAGVPKETRDYVERVMANGGNGTGGDTGTGTASDAPSSGAQTQDAFVRQQTLDGLFADQQAAFNSMGPMGYIETPAGGGVQVPMLNADSSPEDWLQTERIFEQTKEKFDLTQKQMDPLKPANVNTIDEIMASSDKNAQAAVMAGISSWSSQNQDAAYAQLAEKNPTMPIIGELYANKHENIALSALSGQALRKGDPNLEKGWTDSAVLGAYNNYVGDAAAGFDGETRSAVLDVAKSIYADMTKFTPTKPFDDGLFEQAIAQAVGMTVADVNDFKTFLPEGVDANVVDTWIASATPEQWAAASMRKSLPLDADRTPISADELSNAQLIAVDNKGHYMVSISDGPVWSGAINASGNPEAFIVEITNNNELTADIEDVAGPMPNVDGTTTALGLPASTVPPPPPGRANADSYAAVKETIDAQPAPAPTPEPNVQSGPWNQYRTPSEQFGLRQQGTPPSNARTRQTVIDNFTAGLDKDGVKGPMRQRAIDAFMKALDN